MRKTSAILACSLMFGSACLPRAARADDNPAAQLTVDVPPAVRDAVTRELDGGRLVGLTLLTDKDNDDAPYYEAKAIIHDSDYTIQVEPGGRVLSKFIQDPDPVAQTVDANDLPDAVKATLAREAASGTTHDVTRQDKQAVYTIRLTIKGKHYTLKIDDAGRLISKDLTDTDSDTGGRRSA